MNRKVLLLALSMTLLSSAAQAAGTPTHDSAAIAREQGLRDLSAGRYQYAEAYLRQATKEAPKDPALHYYLANALVYLKKHQEAIDEYQRSYILDPYGPVSGYCRRALKSYNANIPDNTEDGAQPPPKLAQIEHPDLSAHAEDATSRSAVNDGIGVIRSQAEKEKDRHRSIAASQSSRFIKTGENQAKQIEEDAKVEIDRILNPPIMIGNRINPLYLNPDMLKAQADEVRRNADEAARIARATAAEKASAYERWSHDRETLLDNTADALERQLHERNLPGTPRLTENGTGLYVRNYSQPSEPSPYPEAHQGVARIKRVVFGPQDAEHGNEQQLRARQDSGNDGNTVRGTVINPGRAVASQ